MNRIAIAALLLAACSHSEKATAPTGLGKPTAPVAVEAELQNTRARLTVRPEADGKDVTVLVSGVDGLAVESEAQLLRGATLQRGEARSFEVAFKPGPGQSLLVVSVEGTFAGARRARVVSFALGTPTAEQQRGQGTVITTDDGQKLKLMPAAQ